jgi:hypothetical protein
MMHGLLVSLSSSFRRLTRSLALVAGLAGLGSTAIGEGYTYDPPTCGATYRHEPGKPEQLRFIWEMSAAQECIKQSRFPVACGHLKTALASAAQFEPGAGHLEDMKIYLKTMIRTHGCQ